MAVELKREQILAALATTLGVTRNDPLGSLDGAGFVTLVDGDSENTEEFINPPIYEWTMRPFLLIVAEGSDADTMPNAALAAQIEAFATTIEGVVDGLGGLVTDIRAQAPDFAPREVFGRTGLKGAELGIELDYWSSSSLG